MKLAEKNIMTEGDLDFDQTFQMGIDPKAMQVIIEALTSGLYNDPPTAVLREYTSNAVDSHKEAGQTRPVEVTLPNRLSPNLVIQDWGVGLSRKELIEFGQYGASTKRTTNDQIGGFGLGSKSALALTSQFTVTAVKDGKKNVAVIGYTEEGPAGGFMDETDTDEPNGVKITIPTNESYKFQNAFNEGMFFGFPKGSIKFNGQTPESIHDNPAYTKIEAEDGTLLGWHANTRVGGYSGAPALVGPVRYFVEWDKLGLDLPYALINGFLAEVVLNLPNGEVDIPRSRESIQYTGRTKRVIKAIVDQVIAQGKKVYEEQVESAENEREALVRRFNAFKNGFKGDYTYQGDTITFPTLTATFGSLSVTSAQPVERGDKVHNERFKSQVQSRFNDHQDIQRLIERRTLLVHNAGALSVSGNAYGMHEISALAGMYARSEEDAGESFLGTTIYFVDAPLSAFDRWRLAAFEETISGEEFKKVGQEYRRELARKARQNAPKGAKPVETIVRTLRYRAGGRGWYDEQKISDLDASAKYILLQSGQDAFTDKVVRVLTTVSNASTWSDLDAILGRFIDETEYTILLANKSWDTSGYKSVLPNIVPLKDAFAEFAKSLKVTSTPMQERAARDLQENRGRWATTMKDEWINKIHRAETREWILGMRSTKIQTDRRYLADAQRQGLYTAPAQSVVAQTLPESPESRYGLLRGLWGAPKWDETILYINLMDAHLAEQGNP